MHAPEHGLLAFSIPGFQKYIARRRAPRRLEAPLRPMRDRRPITGTGSCGRADFGTWDGDVTAAAGRLLWSPPLPRLGRRYPRLPLRRTWLESKEISLGDGWTGLRKIGRTPAGTAVLADIPSAERNTGEVSVNTAPAPTRCTPVILEVKA